MLFDKRKLVNNCKVLYHLLVIYLQIAVLYVNITLYGGIKVDKNTEKSRENNVEIYNDFVKTDIGKKSFILFKVGVIMAVIGFVSFAILVVINVPKKIPEDLSAFFAVSYTISIIGSMLLALYVGQSRYYNLTKKKNK